MPHSDPGDRLSSSWNINAIAWTTAVREGQIHSRRVATDAAIVRVVSSLHPDRILDVGCGEGWLTRALTAQGFETVGVDGSSALIEQAQASGGGIFYTLTYDEIVAAPEQLQGPYDLAVCNFSLLGEPVVPLLATLKTVLRSPAYLVIQTVHPWTACGDMAYTDGWRMEYFTTFGAAAWEPMPWYFRTLQSWLSGLHQAGFQINDCIEPTDPVTQRPLSLIVVAQHA